MSAGIKCVTALVLASGSLPPAGAGQPPTIDFMAARTVTAQMVVDALRHRRHGRAGRDQATGYLRGIKDGSAAVWCRKAAYSAPEVDGEIVAYLARLPPGTRAGAAAPLIVEALQSAFPCAQRKEN